MTNEADMLEAAAKKLRDLAGAAHLAPPWTWYSAQWLTEETWISQEAADYIAAMSPPVALALAELLSQVAGIVRQPPGVGRPDGPAGRTLNVARAILGPGWAMQQAAADLASIEQEGDA